MRDNHTRDAVLLAFQKDCPRPQPNEIADWAQPCQAAPERGPPGGEQRDPSA